MYSHALMIIEVSPSKVSTASKLRKLRKLSKCWTLYGRVRLCSGRGEGKFMRGATRKVHSGCQEFDGK
jgi:hypothetical protein